MGLSVAVCVGTRHVGAWREMRMDLAQICPLGARAGEGP